MWSEIKQLAKGPLNSSTNINPPSKVKIGIKIPTLAILLLTIFHYLCNHYPVFYFLVFKTHLCRMALAPPRPIQVKGSEPAWHPSESWS